MKRIITILVFLIISPIIFAQTPQKMSYQAIIRDNAGELVSDHAVGVKMSILKGAASADAIYAETHIRETNENGLLSLEIGGGNVVIGDFSSIDWSSGSYFLQVETDPTGGETYSIAGVSQLLSVPYALYAKTSGDISGGDKHFVGELFGGGVVFYVYDKGRHGLIASLEDLDNGNDVFWGNVSVNFTTNAWDGATNTSAIIAAGASQPIHAVGLCDSYSSGGFSDWYLPSIWEMNNLYNSAFIVSKVLDEDGDDNTKPLNLLTGYWSSTDFGVTAYVIDMEFNTILAKQKSGGDQFIVRAVRSF